MMHPHMSAYNEIFLDALCDNYSHITLKIFTGCHIMQLLLVNTVFERIFPPQEQKLFPFLLQFSSFPCAGLFPDNIPSLLTPSCAGHPCPVPCTPGHPIPSQVSCCTASPCSPSFPHVFPEAAVLACSV